MFCIFLTPSLLFGLAEGAEPDLLFPAPLHPRPPQVHDRHDVAHAAEMPLAVGCSGAGMNCIEIGLPGKLILSTGLPAYSDTGHSDILLTVTLFTCGEATQVNGL